MYNSTSLETSKGTAKVSSGAGGISAIVFIWGRFWSLLRVAQGHGLTLLIKMEKHNCCHSCTKEIGKDDLIMARPKPLLRNAFRLQLQPLHSRTVAERCLSWKERGNITPSSSDLKDTSSSLLPYVLHFCKPRCATYSGRTTGMYGAAFKTTHEPLGFRMLLQYHHDEY